MYQFLGRFPTVRYNNQNVNNILVKIVLDRLVKTSSTVFYPYVVKEGERPDIIAADYYGDSRYDWLVYLANNIIDPYYQWPLTSEEFSAFILKKYGTLEIASQEIAFWRNNWYGDDSIVTQAYYEALPSYAKKYWAPFSGYTNGSSYIRKKIDFTLETNKIIAITTSSNNITISGNSIFQYTSGTLTGRGFIMKNSDNTLVVKDVIGTFVANTVYTTSNAASDSVSLVTDVATSIPSAEGAYWEYVTKYDYEEELNEGRKHIQIIDKRYLSTIESELDSLL